jgi:TolB protein
VAFKREDGGRREIWTVRAAGGLPERVSDGAGVDLHPAWAPDGSALAYASERHGQSHIWIAPIHEGRRVGPSRPLSAGDTTDQLPAWTPDGRAIAYVGVGQNHQDVWIAPADGGAQPHRLVGGSQILGRLRWESSTGWLWFSRPDAGGRLQLWKVAPTGGDPSLAAGSEMVAGASPPGEFDLSPDGRLLALTVESVRGDIWLLHADGGAY